MTTPPLSSAGRSRAIDDLAATGEGRRPPLDVLVIGGGVVGAGAALDATSRGLEAGVIEARDWASGTSSRSSKLLHGGLRYLEMLDFALVREALTERGLLLTRLAPHLARPVPFLYPLEHHVWERTYVGSGVALYDAMSLTGSTRTGVPFHKHLSQTAVEKLFPALREDAVVGALRYYDAQVDDARFVATLVRTAAELGTLAASRTQATAYLREEGRIVGVRAVDLETGRELAVRARHVVLATGVWTEENEGLPRRDAGTAGRSAAGAAVPVPDGQLKVLASKGIHLVVPREAIDGRGGVILRTEKSVLFIIPWDDYWVLGTTDTAWHLPRAHPVASSTDIDYLLEHVNSVLRRPLTREDVIATYAGLRPLVQPLDADPAASAKVSREHTVVGPEPGLTTIAGGKFTTYRVMAADVVDAALGERAKELPSHTDRLPLAGAVGYEVRVRQRARIAARHGWDEARVTRLLRRYGGLIGDLLALVDEDPELGRPVPHLDRYLKAEIVYAVTHEGALHLEDVLVRRTRASYEVRDRGADAAEAVAGLMAPLLGWDGRTVRGEIGAYRERVRAERRAEAEPTDETAEARRSQAPEIRPPVGGAVA